jgi:hypothetical protein
MIGGGGRIIEFWIDCDRDGNYDSNEQAVESPEFEDMSVELHYFTAARVSTLPLTQANLQTIIDDANRIMIRRDSYDDRRAMRRFSLQGQLQTWTPNSGSGVPWLPRHQNSELGRDALLENLDYDVRFVEQMQWCGRPVNGAGCASVGDLGSIVLSAQGAFGEVLVHEFIHGFGIRPHNTISSDYIFWNAFFPGQDLLTQDEREALEN